MNSIFKRSREIFSALFVIAFFVLNVDVKAQNVFASEDELIKQADRYFQDQDFASAYPLYSQLLSIYPKNPDYNYRLGVCMLFSIEDKEKPFKYLEFAVKDPSTDKTVLYYMGRACHLNYRFDEAISYYVKFKQEGPKSDLKKVVDRDIEACNNGKLLLKNLTDLNVLEKKEVDRAEFFRSYDLASLGGKLLAKPEEFQTPLDKKMKDNSVIFLAQNNTQIVYSSYGKDGKNGKDIYAVTKQFNGEWSEPVSLGESINTPYDEDFPMLHPSGKILYFCSKGHNSMGGYDLFRSTLDERTHKWSSPQNLDFAINTPWDEMLMVVDTNEQLAYFASNRVSPNGKINVYKIKIGRAPLNIAVINGKFSNTVSGGAKSRITIKKFKDNELVTVVNTSDPVGDYRLSLTSGVQYLYTVESYGADVQSEVIELTSREGTQVLNQFITYEAGTNKLKISNEIPVDVGVEPSYADMLDLIKEKSLLNVNSETINNQEETGISVTTTDFPSDAPIIEGTTVDTGSVANSEVKNLSDNEIVQIAYSDAKELEEAAQQIKKEADFLFSVVDSKNELAQIKQKEANQLSELAAAETDPVKKQELEEQASSYKKAADNIINETIVTFNFAQKQEKNASAKQEEAELAKQYAADLESTIKAGNNQASLKKLEEQKAKLEEIAKQQGTKDEAYQDYKSDYETKQRMADEALAKSEILKQDIIGLEEEAKKIKAESETTKNDELRQALLNQVIDLENEKSLKEKDLVVNDQRANQLKKEAEIAKSQVELVQDLISKVESGSVDSVSGMSIEERNKIGQDVKTLSESSPDAIAVSEQTEQISKNQEPAPIADTTATIFQPVAEVPVNVQNPVITDSTVVPSDAVSVSAEVKTNEQTSVATPPTLITETKVVTDTFADPSLAIAKAQELEKESDDFFALALTLRSGAANLSSSQEQEMAYEEANQAEKTAMKKYGESATIIAIQNNKAMNENQTSLDKFMASVPQNETSDAFLMTELMKDEADQYTIKAKMLRDQASHTNDFNSQKSLIQRAVEFEELAIEKQQKALEYSTSYTPPAVSSMVPTYASNSMDNSSVPVLSDSVNRHVQAATEIVDSNPVTSNEQANTGQLLPANKNIQAVHNTEAETKSDAIGQEYQALTDEINGALTLSMNEKKRSDSIKNKADEQLKLSQDLLLAADGVEDVIQKQEMLRLAQETEVAANKMIYESDSLKIEAEQHENIAKLKQTKADSILSVAAAGAESRPVASEKITSQSPPIVAPVKEGFSVTSSAVYSDSNPIPIDPQLPEGLVFKVQVGAFKKVIPQNTFKGIAPLSGEKTSSGFIRYTAGLFKDIELANAAKQQVKAMGYKDAFVVAFYNGKRISMNEALAKQGKDMHIEQGTGTPVATPISQSANMNTSSQVKLVASSSESGKYVDENMPATAKDIPVVGGLFYTVQVGVYAQPVPSSKLKYLKPLYSEKSPNGYTRYNCGIYNSVVKASEAKEMIKNKGISDAFVVAYNNGKRVSIQEAKDVESKLGQTAFASNPDMNILPSADISAPFSSEQRPTTNEAKPPVNNGVVYKVQIGAFNQEIPLDMANKFLSIAGKGIDSFKDGSGMTVYTVGIFQDYVSAETLKNEMIASDIPDAFIIAFNGQERISVEEAQRISGK